MFRKYSCGCIGIPLAATDMAMIVKPCDGIGLLWLRRNMEGKSSIPLGIPEASKLHDEIQAAFTELEMARDFKLELKRFIGQ